MGLLGLPPHQVLVLLLTLLASIQMTASEADDLIRRPMREGARRGFFIRAWSSTFGIHCFLMRIDGDVMHLERIAGKRGRAPAIGLRLTRSTLQRPSRSNYRAHMLI